MRLLWFYNFSYQINIVYNKLVQRKCQICGLFYVYYAGRCGYNWFIVIYVIDNDDCITSHIPIDIIKFICYNLSIYMNNKIYFWEQNKIICWTWNGKTSCFSSSRLIGSTEITPVNWSILIKVESKFWKLKSYFVALMLTFLSLQSWFSRNDKRYSIRLFMSVSPSIACTSNVCDNKRNILS